MRTQPGSGGNPDKTFATARRSYGGAAMFGNAGPGFYAVKVSGNGKNLEFSVLPVRTVAAHPYTPNATLRERRVAPSFRS
jgi:hypothetical protein